METAAWAWRRGESFFVWWDECGIIDKDALGFWEVG